MLKKTIFRKEKDFGANDLVRSYRNLDRRSDFKEIVVRDELSPYALGADGTIHNERTITLKTNRLRFFRVDNTFRDTTYVGYETENKSASQQLASVAPQEQCNEIFAFFKSVGLNSEPGLDLLCTSLGEDVEDKLANNGHMIFTAKPNTPFSIVANKQEDSLQVPTNENNGPKM